MVIDLGLQETNSRRTGSGLSDRNTGFSGILWLSSQKPSRKTMRFNLRQGVQELTIAPSA